MSDIFQGSIVVTIRKIYLGAHDKFFYLKVIVVVVVVVVVARVMLFSMGKNEVSFS